MPDDYVKAAIDHLAEAHDRLGGARPSAEKLISIAHVEATIALAQAVQASNWIAQQK